MKLEGSGNDTSLLLLFLMVVSFLISYVYHLVCILVNFE